MKRFFAGLALFEDVSFRALLDQMTIQGGYLNNLRTARAIGKH
jgi:hypothetical protein